MTNQKFDIKFDDSVKEVVIREGKALELSHLENVHIKGIISTPRLFIEYRAQTFDLLKSFIQVDRERMNIMLIVNEQYEHGWYKIEGALELHHDFVKWGVNTGLDRTPKDLAEFIKMNRSSFNDTETAMKLVSELQSLRVNVEKEFEKSDNNKGDYKAMIAQKVIKSNIPDEFTLRTPIFKGSKKEFIRCELYINPDSFSVKIVSPEANDIIALIKDNIIDAEIEAIKAEHPELLIVEV